MSLEELRKQIDEIDDELTALFQKRMDICAKIASAKKQNNLPVYDPKRERQKLRDLSDKAKKGRETQIAALYSLIFELSRAEQERIINPKSELMDKSSNSEVV
ncbi:MAG: chorismate mutase [Oscillospiraceae bacterium]|nr:chorismate mutase [Oscillospiraceae bacterium]